MIFDTFKGLKTAKKKKEIKRLNWAFYGAFTLLGGYSSFYCCLILEGNSIPCRVKLANLGCL